MPWPTPQDYNEAIQNPQHCFADPELRAGRPEISALGLPRPITGNFASVYRVRCAKRDWAVRCFFREFADQAQRYSAISRHLNACRLPYTVGFEYLQEGIKVRDTWYPILKMEWVAGELLSDYIGRHQHQTRRLDELAERWADMVKSLQRAEVAHGDLQHGNVLVVNDRIMLVDYDGMYVPALSGSSSHEIGHYNYQHPGRTGKDFGPELDRFSALVIYLSLRAVALRPELWDRTGGDECLLFRKRDFEDPASSDLWAELTGLDDDSMRTLTDGLLSALRGPLRDVPPLQALNGHLRATAPSTDTLSVFHSLWTLAVPAPPAMNSAPRTTTLPEWVTDQVPIESEAGKRDFRSGVRTPRALAIAALGPGAAAGLILPGVNLVVERVVSAGAVTCLVATVLFLLSFRHDPEVRRMRVVLARRRKVLWLLWRTGRAIRRHRRAQRRLEVRDAERRRRAAEATDRVQRAGARRQKALERMVDPIVKDLEQQQVANLALEQEESTLILHGMQAKHLSEILRRARILRSPLVGVGLPTRTWLWFSGVRSAADVTGNRIETLKRLKRDQTVSLLTWRVTLETRAKRTMPQSLPPPILQPLHRRYTRQRDRIERIHVTATAVHDRMSLAIKQHRAATIAVTQERLRITDLRHRRRLKLLDDAIGRLVEVESEQNRRLEECHRDLAPYTDLRFGHYLWRIAGHSRHASTMIT